MKVLINKQSAIEALIQKLYEKPEEYWDNGLNRYDIEETINTLPPEQSEREIGTWIIDSAYPQHCWCSNCNHRFDLFDPKSIHFCPNCGREMKACVWGSLDEREKEEGIEENTNDGQLL